MKKRLFSILLVLCMAFTMLPVTALAEATPAGDEIINEITVSGLTRPVKGETPVTKENVTLTTGLTVESLTWGPDLTDDGKFAAGTTYTALITYSVMDGYRIADNASCPAAPDASVTRWNQEGMAANTIEVTFDPTEENLIVSIPAPVVGFIPATKDSITISYQGINLRIFSVEWSSYVMEKDANGDDKLVSTLLQDNEKFEAGKKYLVHITHELIGRVADIEFTDATLDCYKEGGDGDRTLIFYETKVSTGHDHTYDKAWHDMGDGFHAHKCTLCGAFDTASRKAHYEFPCESKGLEKGHTLKCLLCEYKYDESIIKPHEWTGWKVYDSYYEYTNGHHAKRCNCGQLDYRHTQLVYQSIDAEWHQRVCPIAGCGYKEQRKTNHVYEAGSTVCKYCNFDKSNPTDPDPVEPTPGGSVIIITPETTGPVFLSGANQTVALGSAAAFRIDYNYAAFRSVAVDGVTLTPADYTTWEGSTWVKLTPAYVKTLGIGTHTLSVYFDGATATTTFTVGSQPNPATGARDAVGIAAAAAVIALLGSAVILRKK